MADDTEDSREEMLCEIIDAVLKMTEDEIQELLREFPELGAGSGKAPPTQDDN